MHLLFLLFLLTSLEAAETFFIHQTSLFSSSAFDVDTNRGPLGFVRRKLSTLKMYDYEFYDFESNFQAEACIRWFGIGAKLDLQDAKHYPLGSIHEKRLCLFPTFDFYSAEDQLLATAEMNFWHTQYSFIDPETKTLLGKMTRSYFSAYNKWTLSLDSLHTLDPRFCIFLAVFHSDREYIEKMKKKHD